LRRWAISLDDWKPTVVFETYWRFAAERHSIYLKRLRGKPPQWTGDEHLQQLQPARGGCFSTLGADVPPYERWQFTNVFRASDRVSQYLIRHVIYQSGGSDDDEEVVFRVLLLRLSNSISAWDEALLPGLGEVPSWRKFDVARYARILGDAWKRGVKIYLDNTSLPDLALQFCGANSANNLSKRGSFRSGSQLGLVFRSPYVSRPHGILTTLLSCSKAKFGRLAQP
jgi:hypothetical protein